MKKFIRRVLQWVKAHKRELILAGLSIAAIFAAIFVIRNWPALQALWNDLMGKISGIAAVTASNTSAAETVQAVVDTAVETPVIPTISRAVPELPYAVGPHVRNLHAGMHASATKIAEAAENGYVLLPGQTWVRGYIKYAAA